MDINTPQVIQADCMEFMAQFPDKFFDLAVVDPPYGIGADKHHLIPTGGKAVASKKKYHIKNWDEKAPSREYFFELQRISKNQIVFGANHFIEKIPSANSSAWIVWDKQNGQNNFADCELAFTSFDSAVRKFSFKWQGMLQGDMKNKEDRIHPTQKPVALYDWIFKNYANPGDKILDTHLESGSSRIAAHKHKLPFWACELDGEYFEAQEKRFKEYTSQLTLF